MKDAADRILRSEQARYLEGIEPARDEFLQRMEEFAAKTGEPISDPEVASFLRTAVLAHKPKALVELGTNIGYGAVVLGRAMGPGATLETVEYSETLAGHARSFLADAGLSASVTVCVDDAVQYLQRRTAPVDFVYIDCIKQDYPRYLELLLHRLTPGAVVVADNVLWKGLVASDVVPAAEAERVEALRRFNMMVTRPPFCGVILPLGDGVAYAVKS